MLTPEIEIGGAHNTDRRSRLFVYIEETEGIAESNDPLADKNVRRFAKSGVRQIPIINLENRNVGGAVGTDQLRLIFLASRQGDKNLVSLLDNVLIGDDITIRADHYA